MKKLSLVLICMMVSALVFSQGQDSLNPNQEYNSKVPEQKKDQPNKQSDKDEIKTIFSQSAQGGFFALYSGISNITDKQAIMLGMKFGTILDHWCSFGMGGNFLVTQLTYDDILGNIPVQFEMGYAGMFFEPAIAPKFPFHVSFPVMFGIGGAFYFDRHEHDFDEIDNWTTIDDDVFFIVEPGVELEMNFTKNTRVCLGVKYRYISDLQLLNTEEDAFNGFTYGLTIKFGKF